MKNDKVQISEFILTIKSPNFQAVSEYFRIISFGKLDLPVIILNGGKICGNLDFVIFYVGRSAEI
jgi:hypothetical protein